MGLDTTGTGESRSPAGQRSDLSNVKKWWRTLGGDGFAVRLATDDDLPRPLRVAAARTADDQVAHVRERAALHPGVTEAEVLAAADRYEATRAELEALLPRWKTPVRVLIGVADPAQPLWHYAVDPRSHSWLRRAQEVADAPRLTDAARAIGLRTAREHYVFRYPDQVRPALTDGQPAAAHAWAQARADLPTEG